MQAFIQAFVFIIALHSRSDYNFLNLFMLYKKTLNGRNELIACSVDQKWI